MVGALVGSPQAKGLFTRAIGQSGGWMGLMMGRMRQASAAEADGVKALQAMNVSSIAELRAKPLSEINIPGGAGLLIDGYLIPEDLSYTFQAGKQNAVDVLTGSNKDEANFGICPGAGGRGGGPALTAEAFRAAAERRLGEGAATYLKLYPVATDADAQPAAHMACADEISWNMRQWAASHSKKGKKAYTYFFTRIQTVNGQPSPQGATHTAEISFAWNNPKGQATQTWNDVDVKLADQMSSYWANFIIKGDPNGKTPDGRDLPRWPEFKDLSSKVMVLGDTPIAELSVPSDKLAFFSSAYQRLLRTNATN
jgi:para-nitrobenzyl esterase